MSEQARNALCQLIGELGHGSRKEIAGLMEVSTETIRLWSRGLQKTPDWVRLRVREIREQKNAACEKAAFNDDEVRCQYCGEKIVLSEVAKGRFMVSHQCTSGLTIKLMERSREEAMYALAPVVKRVSEMPCCAGGMKQ